MRGKQTGQDLVDFSSDDDDPGLLDDSTDDDDDDDRPAALRVPTPRACLKPARKVSFAGPVTGPLASASGPRSGPTDILAERTGCHGELVPDSLRRQPAKAPRMLRPSGYATTLTPTPKAMASPGEGSVPDVVTSMPIHSLAERASDTTVDLPEDGTANALLDGVWQSDSSRHCLEDRLKGVDVSQGTVTLEAPNGRPTLRVAYFFSGVKRKASIAGFLKTMCVDAKVGLTMHEIDILVGGDEHNLMDKTAQEEWLNQVRGGNFDIVIFIPPCGTWSRANWANDSGPQPCRNRKHP